MWTSSMSNRQTLMTVTYFIYKDVEYSLQKKMILQDNSYKQILLKS